jgi:amino acid adenylation domain-containing protein
LHLRLSALTTESVLCICLFYLYRYNQFGGLENSHPWPAFRFELMQLSQAKTFSLALKPLDYGGPVDRPFEAFPESAIDTSIVARFASIVARHSDRLAIQDHASTLTYRELSALASRITSAVASAGAAREGPVGILLGRDARYPAAMLGILAAGCAYAALDASHPFERNRMIVAQAGIRAVVSAGDAAVQAEKLFSGRALVIDIDTLPGSSPATGSVVKPASADLGYIYFTSGSEGAPKGVPHRHRDMLQLVRQFTNAVHIGPEDRLTTFYSASNMAAARDIFAALLNGASLHMLSPADLQAEGIAREIHKRGITLYHSTPGLLRRIEETLGTNDRLDSVRVAAIGGDRVEWRDIDMVWRIFSPDVFVYMALTSTETHLRSHWFIDSALRDTAIRPPVGWPLPHVTMSFVDEDGMPVADGAFGEILVSSRFIANGYWNAPAQSAATFTNDSSDHSLTTFRTGDIGRRRPDGLIEFLGRKDHQIKLHGYRIDIGEVEDALRSCDGVQDAVVVVRKNDVGVPRALAAYVERSPEAGDLQRRKLLPALTDRLPRYMIPATINALDQLPRLPSLKIDRMSITQLDAARVAETINPADDPIIDKLIEIFEGVLGNVGATAEDSVSSLGGDSLQAIRIALELEKNFRVAIAPEVFESIQTIRELARWIAVQ